ncbi:unnamed protein product, partial [marine sediment metagenome]
PPLYLWICKVDGVVKPVTVSAWQDEWTLLLTVPEIPDLPGRVTLKYDKPHENLRTTWDKQWEPWGPILSKRIPYLWEDILVVDIVNKRVGIERMEPLYSLDVDEIGNSAGDFKIQPDVQGNVALFGDTNVDDDSHGKRLIIHRKAEEGNEYFQFFISQIGVGVFQCSNRVSFEALAGYVHFASAADRDIYFDAGGCFYFRDKDAANAVRASLNSANGNFDVTGVYKVDDVQVVGVQGAAVADATGADDVVARLNELLARVRAHGLIAT